MKNSQAVAIYQQKELLNNLKGYKFTKAVIVNLQKIKEELEYINMYVKPSKEFIEYHKLKEEMLIKYSDGKHETNGEYINYIIPEDKKEDYSREINALAAEYKEVLDSSRENANKYSEAVESECTIDFMLIDEKDIPEDISVQQMEQIIHWIKMK